MRIYSVHEIREADPDDRDAAVMLVAEGFCWPAFLFSAAWALARGLWTTAAATVVLVAAAMAAAVLIGDGRMGAVGLAATMLTLGAFGNDLRRWRLGRRGYLFTGVVAGPDEDAAVLRLFSRLGPRIYLP
jgi:hypothetical protein